MCGDSAAAVEICKLQAGAEFEEGVPAEYRGDEGGVGLQDRGDLGEERREVVDPMQGQGGEDGIEGTGGEGERLSVWVWKDGAGVRGKEGVESEVGIAVQQGGGPVSGGKVREACVEGRVGGGGWGLCGEDTGNVTSIGAEVEDAGELAADVL